MARGATISNTELTRQATAYKVEYLATKDYVLHLFTNDHSPAPGDILANYTECVTAGYVSQVIPKTQWTVAAPIANAVLIVQTNPRRFVPSALATAVQIYGYFVTDELGRFAWAEAFTTPQNFTPGNFIDVRAKYRFANCAVP